MNDLLADQLKMLWQRQSAQAEQIVLLQARDHFGRLRRSVVIRNSLDWAACILLVGILTWRLWVESEDWMATLVRMYFIGLFVWIGAVLWLKGRVPRASVTGSVTSYLEHVIDIHERHHRLWSKASRWYLAPIALGFALLLMHRLFTNEPGLLWLTVLTAVLMAGAIVASEWWLRRKMRELRAEIDELKALRSNLGSDPTGGA